MGLAVTLVLLVPVLSTFQPWRVTAFMKLFSRTISRLQVDACPRCPDTQSGRRAQPPRLYADRDPTYYLSCELKGTRSGHGGRRAVQEQSVLDVQQFFKS